MRQIIGFRILMDDFEYYKKGPTLSVKIVKLPYKLFPTASVYNTDIEPLVVKLTVASNLFWICVSPQLIIAVIEVQEIANGIGWLIVLVRFI